MTTTTAPARLTITDAKALTADIRKAVRAATRTPGDVLHGLTVSVRYTTASCMQAIEITVKGLDHGMLFTVTEHPHYGPRRQWSEQAHSIADRLHELAAAGFEWTDGRHSFCDATFDGISTPAPRALSAEDMLDAEYERRNAEEIAELAADAARFGVQRGHLAALR